MPDLNLTDSTLQGNRRIRHNAQPQPGTPGKPSRPHVIPPKREREKKNRQNRKSLDIHQGIPSHATVCPPNPRKTQTLKLGTARKARTSMLGNCLAGRAPTERTPRGSPKQHSELQARSTPTAQRTRHMSCTYVAPTLPEYRGRRTSGVVRAGESDGKCQERRGVVSVVSGPEVTSSGAAGGGNRCAPHAASPAPGFALRKVAERTKDLAAAARARAA
ncbi:hypothetical protein B0T16DRAFT_415723 [Cercophora newfieldiana]|uniref:Uncharacterized protein n=1 Tax=Cercophora newfieldiana TaxID=92897 RepID=A0AA40CMZ3_9PEZI|nr:hypothetical protein B0T16DRAFT_415723 [Cercophora newfieldiana]